MTELVKAVTLSGMVDESMLRELTKWRLPIDLPEEELELFTSPEDAIEAIEAAIEGPDQVEIRTTDLDVVRQYLRTQRAGKLHLKAAHTSGSWEIQFGVTTTGDYILPWRYESLNELLLDDDSYLLDGKRKVRFASVKDLYFGEQKTFVLCQPRKGRHESKG